MLYISAFNFYYVSYLPNIGPAILIQLFFFVENQLNRNFHTAHYCSFDPNYSSESINRVILVTELIFLDLFTLLLFRSFQSNDVMNFTLTLFQNLQIIYDIHSLAFRGNLIFTMSYLSSCTKFYWYTAAAAVKIGELYSLLVREMIFNVCSSFSLLFLNLDK